MLHFHFYSVEENFFCFWPCGMWDLSSPDQGSNLGILHWKHGILTTEPPGKSQWDTFQKGLIMDRMQQFIMFIAWLENKSKWRQTVFLQLVILLKPKSRKLSRENTVNHKIMSQGENKIAVYKLVPQQVESRLEYVCLNL